MSREGSSPRASCSCRTRIGKTNAPTVYSPPLAARLEARVPYRIELSDFYNMSYLDSNRSFGAAGGVDGPSNRFGIYGVRLLPTHGTTP